MSDITPTADIRPAARTWRAFRKNPLGISSAIILLVLATIAILAPYLAKFPSGYGRNILMPPSPENWFGTDDLGRDIYAQIIWGTRISMTIGFAASSLAIMIGVAVGVLAAYAKRLDAPLSMLVDVSLALPVLPLMILIAALVGPSLQTLIVVIALFSWPEVARVVRSQALSVTKLPYVDAARTIGGSHLWIIIRHILPAVAPIIIVAVVLTASRAVLSEAGLAFLGLGDPETWSWGTVLYNAQRSGSLTIAWWATFFPSIAILILVVAATLVSIAYNDARNPKTRES
ncbi:ABC transporter permease [Ketogulonicigenium vulgare]|uniref:ABC-type dipeptide/oligopeptide/nickel transport system, permease component n=1 Tax=Ketogulonicigenium vulgare (strain WSH-001) TaxID=759362 RepID=F9Y5Y2_KETVW|nr:ABC transporter permease [Ketogulonicigenium vulgare]AEM40807.1 ABC-type dipeptide/oligopeptide/nickel transport system, permease component [Ketogulonicigenium vulgare WSH-001]ALJ80972.1 peptide ABC transporter permease [Ketogulonicigenium vulgare]ANW33737.1 peptide ABC transporter permease [Ketogulonicigenium vulgare]AOZ54525.1 ABC-type dipeptide/oligopeptide/nickel transport system, permease component [Ketogulonicigenium vulgare]